MYSLKIFQFCNIEDIELVCGVSCKQREPLHSVRYWNPLGSSVMPDAEDSPATVQNLAVCVGLGSRGNASGSIQVGQGAAGCAW